MLLGIPRLAKHSMSEYRDHSAEFKRRFFDHVVIATNKTAMQIQRDAKLNISGRYEQKLKAVDTGRLMNSISVTNSETGPQVGEVEPTPNNSEASINDGIKKPPQQNGVIIGAVGSNVVYAPYVELGTVKMGPRPFLRAALEMNKNTFAKHLKFNPDSMGTDTK
jgi:HK97 gp10 family phage protein